jgi:hypothetical protein
VVTKTPLWVGPLRTGQLVRMGRILPLPSTPRHTTEARNRLHGSTCKEVSVRGVLLGRPSAAYTVPVVSGRELRRCSGDSSAARAHPLRQQVSTTTACYQQQPSDYNHAQLPLQLPAPGRTAGRPLSPRQLTRGKP